MNDDLNLQQAEVVDADLAGGTILSCGRYMGQPLRTRDVDYIAWVAHFMQNPCYANVRDAAATYLSYLNEHPGACVVTFGKHIGKRLDEIHHRPWFRWYTRRSNDALFDRNPRLRKAAESVLKADNSAAHGVRKPQAPLAVSKSKNPPTIQNTSQALIGSAPVMRPRISPARMTDADPAPARPVPRLGAPSTEALAPSTPETRVASARKRRRTESGDGAAGPVLPAPDSAHSPVRAQKRRKLTLPVRNEERGFSLSQACSQRSSTSA